MKISCEYEENISDYFEDFKEKINIPGKKEIPISIFSMDAIRIWSKEMEQSFYDSFVQELKRIQRDNKGLDGYDLFQASAYCCSKGDVLIRHWNALEEQSLALIFRSEIIKTSTLLAQV